MDFSLGIEDEFEPEHQQLEGGVRGSGQLQQPQDGQLQPQQVEALEIVDELEVLPALARLEQRQIPVINTLESDLRLRSTWEREIVDLHGQNATTAQRVVTTTEENSVQSQLSKRDNGPRGDVRPMANQNVQALNPTPDVTSNNQPNVTANNNPNVTASNPPVGGG